jgi:hypothetical protein
MYHERDNSHLLHVPDLMAGEQDSKISVRVTPETKSNIYTWHKQLLELATVSCTYIETPCRDRLEQKMKTLELNLKVSVPT